jgi:hypothetical protein
MDRSLSAFGVRERRATTGHERIFHCIERKIHTSASADDAGRGELRGFFAKNITPRSRQCVRTVRTGHRMSPEDRQVVRSLLEGMILKHDAKRYLHNDERQQS